MKFFCYPIWYTQWPKAYKVYLSPFSQKCNMQRGSFLEWNYNACMFHIWSLYSIIETLNMNISNLDITFQCLSLSFSQAQSLTTIDLSHSHLTGQIISSLPKLIKLQRGCLFVISFTGSNFLCYYSEDFFFFFSGLKLVGIFK